MITATRIHLAGTWSGTPADVLHLERDDRHRRRMVMRCVGKTAFLLNLPEAKVLKHGDALELEDGRLIAIESAPEALLDITATDPAHLVRIAWHLGNRHLPTQLLGDRLRIREDHVIEDMLVKLGATVAHVSAAFDPEGGAYGHGTVQGHDHHDHHGHDHHSHDLHDHAHHGHDHHAHDHSGHAHDADGNCIHDHHDHAHHDHAHGHDHHHAHGHHDHAHDADGNCLPGHDHKHG